MSNFFQNFEKYEFPLFGLVRLPEIVVTEDQKKSVGLPKNATNHEFLTQLCRKGFQDRKKLFDQTKIQEYVDRIKFELDLVAELSFTDYFLLVWKIINKTRELGYFTDFGRGSCGASLIFYCLGVTNGADPIKKKLLFSRFISKVRAKKQVIDGVTFLQGDLAPDVDLNLGDARPSILKWLKEEYPNKICRIAALGTFTGKILIKDVYKAVDDVNEEEASRVANLIEKQFGIVEDIEKMPEISSQFKKWSDGHKETYEIALKLRDLIKQKSSHASGYMISYEKSENFVPLELNKDKEVTESFSMDDAANLSIKLDLLGLTSNAIVKEILDNIPENIDEITPKLDGDPIIYDQFQHGTLLPYGLYQISADCAYRVLNDIKPKTMEELMAVNAIARPGALSYLKEYVENNSPCPHPAFKHILEPTRNYCLYQEQMIQMAAAIGFTEDEGELLRRIVGKKKIEEVKLWKEKVYEKCEKNGFSKEIGDIFWKILDDSSKYSFNAGHCCTTSYMGALTVYLKYKYPLQYYVACLNCVDESPNPTDEISKIKYELQYFDIKLLPPHILKSDVKFKTEGKDIRFGLSSIKGISEETIEKLKNFRHQYSTKFDIFKAANECHIPSNVLSSIIMSGSMDDMLTESRSKTMLEAILWNKLTDKEKTKCLEYGKEYNYNLFELVKNGLTTNIKDIKGKPIIKASRLETIKKNFGPYEELYKFNNKHREFARFWYENQLLGFAFSTNLHQIYSAVDNSLITIQDFASLEDNDNVKIAGQVVEAIKGKSREKQTEYLKVIIKDHTGQLSVLLFNTSNNANIDKCEEDNGKLPNEGDIVIVRGKKKGDCIFASTIGIQDVKVLMTVSKLQAETKKRGD